MTCYTKGYVSLGNDPDFERDAAWLCDCLTVCSFNDEMGGYYCMECSKVLENCYARELEEDIFEAFKD